MKDCKFLLPFVDEIRRLFPGHEVEWVRDDSNTEYEEIQIDGQKVMSTDVSEYESDYCYETSRPKYSRHHSIIVHFPFIKTEYEYEGLHVIDPYRENYPSERFELFCGHECLRCIFPWLMESDESVIKKVMNNLHLMDESQKDFH